jgi:hypothetical protein
MAIVMPTDLGDANVWGPILDQALGVVVDRHDHTTGKGVKIPSAALNINADVSWSSGGTSRAITDLKAVDFTPSAVQTALTGALFVSDGTSSLTANELYWRTTSGVNVKLTAGSALNVAAFTGGIGGDYSAVGALVVFDDATDSYWFQQQTGAGVRQYARMRSADVDLYEFKANPTAGVPTNRVRLASPSALAANYAITFPPALPGTAGLLAVSSAGVGSFVPSVLPTTGERPIWVSPSGSFSASIAQTVYSHASAIPTAGTPVAFNTNYTIGVAGTLVLPLNLVVGQSFATWTVFLNKASNSGTSITASLLENSNTASTGIGPTQTTSANAPGATSLSGVGTVPVAQKFYSIVVSTVGPGGAADLIAGWQVNP